MAGLRRILRSDPTKNELRRFADRAGWRFKVDAVAKRRGDPWCKFIDRDGNEVMSFRDFGAALRWFRGTASPGAQWWND